MFFMRKNMLSALLTLALISTMAAPAFATEPVSNDLPPVISERPTADSDRDSTHQYAIEVNGQSLDASACVVVPLRSVAEALGFTVTWNNGTILVDNGTVHTRITLGVDRYQITTSKEDMVGMSAPFSLGTPPYSVDGVSYVPLGLFNVLLGNKDGVITLDGNKIIIQPNQ